MADAGNTPVLMVLGSFQFSLNTLVFNEWSRTTEWKWPDQERLGQLDALQFTGPGKESLTLPGELLPNFKGDVKGIDTLRGLADDGVPYLLTDSYGFVLGRWVIESIDEKQTIHDTKGKPQKIEFTIKLRKFDDGQKPDGTSNAGLPDAPADILGPVTDASAVSGFSSMVKSVQASATSAIGQLKAVSAQVTAVVAPVLAQATSAVGAINRSLAVVTDLRNTAGEIGAQVQAIGNIAGAASGAKTLVDKITSLGIRASSATSVIGNITALAGATPVAVTNVLSTATNATTGVSTLLASASNAASALEKKFTS